MDGSQLKNSFFPSTDHEMSLGWLEPIQTPIYGKINSTPVLMEFCLFVEIWGCFGLVLWSF